MATIEILQTQAQHPLSETYPTLEANIDPLEIAVQALAKLKEHGLSGYVASKAVEEHYQKAEMNHQPDAIVKKPVRQKRTSSEVTNLDEYRGTQKIKQLNNAERLKLVSRAKQGDETALEKLWLDAQHAANYVANSSHTNWHNEDKVQTCLEVVPGAVQRYDSSKGASFKNYLIRRMIGALKDEERAYSRSNGLERGSYKMLQEAIKSKHPQAALHELTQPEKTATGKVKPGFIMAPHLVYGNDVISYQASLEELMYGSGDDEGGGSAIEPVASMDVLEEAIQKVEIEKLREIVQLLPERERQVLCHYHGLFGTPAMNLREIGEEIDLTESRVWQIYAKAMKHLSVAWENEEIDFQQPNRLRKIEAQPPSVRDYKFKKRIYNELDKLSGSKLSEEEVKIVLNHFCDWKINHVVKGDSKYKLIHRPLPDTVNVDDLELTNDDASRRKIGRKGNSICMIVQDVYGSDLQLAIKLEQEIRQLKTNYNSEFAAQFTKRELEIITNLYESNGQLGIKLGIGESTVRTFIHKSMQKLGISSAADLAVMAARKGIISLDNVPVGRTLALNSRESQLLRDCYNLSYKEGAAALGISKNTYRAHWHNIFTKTGGLTQVQAVLMALKDGLIPITTIE